jgi:iron complex transport system ATP-binding protein
MTNAIAAAAVSVRRGARDILAAVSIEVAYGSIAAVVGPNGAGKSTLIKTIAGLTQYTGSISIDGADGARMTMGDRARALAYVPQRSLLLDGLSVYDVVAQARYAHRRTFGRVDARDAPVERALERTSLGDVAERAYHTLSGGEQRRVLLARALATGARILLFDEPTAGLDVAHALRFFALLDQLRAEGCAVVCALHDLGDVRRHADVALLLDRGRGVAYGPAREALSAARIEEVYGVHIHEGVAAGFSLDGKWR